MVEVIYFLFLCFTRIIELRSFPPCSSSCITKLNLQTDSEIVNLSRAIKKSFRVDWFHVWWSRFFDDLNVSLSRLIEKQSECKMKSRATIEFQTCKCSSITTSERFTICITKVWKNWTQLIVTWINPTSENCISFSEKIVGANSICSDFPQQASRTHWTEHKIARKGFQFYFMTFWFDCRRFMILNSVRLNFMQCLKASAGTARRTEMFTPSWMLSS